MATFADRMKELRAEKRISGPQLAENLGVSDSTISMWETGVRFPRKKYMDALCDYFGVSPSYLMGKTDFKNEEETMFYFLLEDSPESSSKTYEKIFNSYAEKEHPELLAFRKFQSLTDEHKKIISDMIDMYYEKDK